MVTLDGLVRSAVKGLTFLGRTLEFFFTGETHYFFATSELADVEVVDDRIKANRLLGEVRQLLFNDFGLSVEHPVIVEIEALGRRDLRDALHHRRGSLGKYRMQDMGKGSAHCISIVGGLGAERFKALLAHEIAHAWLREKNLLTGDRVMREGLARWVEYKVLLKLGRKNEAGKVRGIRLWSYGRGIRRFLDIEERVGEAKVLDFARRGESGVLKE
jgi:hypothetical protein